MKQILALSLLSSAAFLSSGCVALIGDSDYSVKGYTTDNGRCSHLTTKEKLDDGSIKTVTTTTCEQEVGG